MCVLSHYEFKVPDAFQKLIDSVESTMRHAIVEEENIPFETVTNFDEVISQSSKPLCHSIGCKVI